MNSGISILDIDGRVARARTSRRALAGGAVKARRAGRSGEDRRPGRMGFRSDRCVGEAAGRGKSLPAGHRAERRDGRKRQNCRQRRTTRRAHRADCAVGSAHRAIGHGLIRRHRGHPAAVRHGLSVGRHGYVSAAAERDRQGKRNRRDASEETHGVCYRAGAAASPKRGEIALFGDGRGAPRYARTMRVSQ